MHLFLFSHAHIACFEQGQKTVARQYQLERKHAKCIMIPHKMQESNDLRHYLPYFLYFISDMTFFSRVGSAMCRGPHIFPVNTMAQKCPLSLKFDFVFLVKDNHAAIYLAGCHVKKVPVWQNRIMQHKQRRVKTLAIAIRTVEGYELSTLAYFLFP